MSGTTPGHTVEAAAEPLDAEDVGTKPACGDGAWDLTRPPEPDLLDACVHCGFCLPTCPTYTLWQEEMDSPRGRIVLMVEGHEPGGDLSDAMVEHFDNCLGCMACVTACPSGVRYDLLLQDTRAQVARHHDRPLHEKALRKAIFALFPRPGRLRALVPAMALGKYLPKLGPLKLAPPVNARQAVDRLPEFTRASPHVPYRGTAGFLQGCVQRVMFGDVNRKTVEVLSAEGYDVVAPRRPGCCGSLAQHAGNEDQARDFARRTIDAYSRFPVVVTNAAGCGSGMKEMAHLLRDDPLYAHAAERFATKVRDVHELLAEHAPATKRWPIGVHKVAYHDACHLAHAQGVRAQPRDLLTGIPGVELVEPAEWEICCGSAGIYNLTKREPAAELGRRKAENLRATDAEVIAAANPGCALQITAYLPEIPIVHPIELLHRSICG